MLISTSILPLLSGSNDGAFRGIQRAQADIEYFEYSGQYAVMDDLTVTDASSVPEPGSILLFGSGVLGLLAKARQRRRSARS
jgi:hypothetical protein